MDRIDPLRNFRFVLEVGDIKHAGFSDVAVAETSIDAGCDTSRPILARTRSTRTSSETCSPRAMRRASEATPTAR